MVFCHSGGLVGGGLDTHDSSYRRLCTDAVVVSVDDQLAAEHVYPAGFEGGEGYLLAHSTWVRQALPRRATGGDTYAAALGPRVSM